MKSTPLAPSSIIDTWVDFVHTISKLVNDESMVLRKQFNSMKYEIPFSEVELANARAREGIKQRFQSIHRNL